MTAVAPEQAAVKVERGVCWDWVTWVLLALLAVFVGVAFFPAVKASFVDLDDQIYVFGNPRVLQGVTPGNLVWAATTRKGGLYIPATWVSLQVDATISRWMGLDDLRAVLQALAMPDGRVYHTTNIVLHAVSAWMLFLFLYRATGNRWAGFAVALLWAVHPLRVESVAWVTERKDELAGVFGFLAMYWYVAWKQGGSRWWFWGSCVALVMSLWGKPMFTVMPGLLVIVDWWPLGKIKGWRDVLRSALEKWPMWGVALLDAIASMIAARGNGTLKISELEKSGNAILSYVRYIEMQADFGKLAPFYPYVGLSWAKVGGAVAILLAITVGTVLLRRRYPGLLAGWLWYLLGALPTIGFVQAFTQAYADRYTYLGSVGLVGMVVYGAFRWRRAAPALAAGAVVLGVVLSVFAYRQTEYWHDSVRLFERAREVTPMSRELHWSLSYAYFREKRLQDAEEQCQAVIAADPNFKEARWLMATIYRREGRTDLAVAEARKGVEIAPEDGMSLKIYGLMLMFEGRYPEALGPLEKAATKLPEDEDVQQALARVREMVGPRG